MRNGITKWRYIFLGAVDDDIDFMYGDNTEVLEGCAVQSYGEMLYFGGRSEQRQVFSTAWKFLKKLKKLKSNFRSAK